MGDGEGGGERFNQALPRYMMAIIGGYGSECLVTPRPPAMYRAFCTGHYVVNELSDVKVDIVASSAQGTSSHTSGVVSGFKRLTSVYTHGYGMFVQWDGLFQTMFRVFQKSVGRFQTNRLIIGGILMMIYFKLYLGVYNI